MMFESRRENGMFRIMKKYEERRKNRSVLAFSYNHLSYPPQLLDPY